MRKSSALLFIVVLMLLFTSCTARPGAADEYGEMLRYSEEELKVHSLEGMQGIYVRNSDESYSPVINAFTGYERISKKGGSCCSRYLWFTENSSNILNLVPHVSSSSGLVLIYNSTGAIPEEFPLERYDYKGYTVGCHLRSSSSGKMYLMTSGSLTGTHVSSVIDSIEDEEEYEVTGFNEGADLPVENIDGCMNLLLGLDEYAYYRFDLYKGTKYVSITTKADAQVFQSAGLTYIKNPYTRTQDGYFTVNLPEDLEEGYYYICEMGMFYFEGN